MTSVSTRLLRHSFGLRKEARLRLGRSFSASGALMSKRPNEGTCLCLEVPRREARAPRVRRLISSKLSVSTVMEILVAIALIVPR